jgi:hypothetical protein
LLVNAIDIALEVTRFPIIAELELPDRVILTTMSIGAPMLPIGELPSNDAPKSINKPYKICYLLFN